MAGSNRGQYCLPVMVSLVLQFLFLGVGVLAVDGGEFLKIVEFSLLATWVTTISVIWRRAKKPTEFDLWVLQFCFPVFLVLFERVSRFG